MRRCICFVKTRFLVLSERKEEEKKKENEKNEKLEGSVKCIEIGPRTDN